MFAFSTTIRPTKDKSLCSIKAASEKDAASAQKLGQLQLFIVVIPQECTGQLWANLTPVSRQHLELTEMVTDAFAPHAEAEAGLGRIVAMYYRSSASYQNYSHIRYLCL